MSLRDVQEHIGPAERGIAARLHQLSDGVPAAVEALWEAWVAESVVAKDEEGEWRVADAGRGWVFGDARDQAYALLEQLIAGAPFDLPTTEAILGCAAFEGNAFTVQAVARALDLAPDVLLDFLDDYLLEEEERPGLVREVGFLALPGLGYGQQPSLYRFAYPHLWHIWHKYGPSGDERRDMALRLAEALEIVYHTAPDHAAHRLAALFELGGRPDRAEPFRRRMQQTADIVVLRWQIDVLEKSVRSEFDDVRLFELRMMLSKRLRTIAAYEEGIDTARAALKQAQAWQALPREAEALSMMGILLYYLGRYGEARPFSERALAINEQVLGPAHPVTAVSLGNLGLLLRAQGDLAGARPFSERALAINEQVLGPTHPDTAGSLSNLGGLFHAQGDLAGALLLHERAFAIREQVLGPIHPDTAGSLSNLGRLLQVQGDLAGARHYFARALAILEQSLGTAHPHTQIAQRNLTALDATLRGEERTEGSEATLGDTEG